MTSEFPIRRAGALAVLVVTATLAGCAAPAPPPPAPVAEVAIPNVKLSPRVIEMAGAYRAYVARATAISPNFADGAGVARGVKIGAAYEPHHLLRGAIAYGAVAALQSPEFVAGVRSYAANADQRRTIAYEIMKDPAYAVSFAGSANAAGLVIAALGADGRRLVDQGRLVKQAAYDVQHAAWSKAEVPGREGRLALAKQLSSTPTPGDMSETSRLQLAITGNTPMGLAAQTAGPPYTPVVIHSLAVAALATLGYADDASLEQVMPILAEPTADSCFSMSKLNLYQCLAVSKPHYEDVFCLGQHVLIDTGHCLMNGAGVPDPVEVKARADHAAAAAAAVQRASTTTTLRPRPKKR